VLDGLFSLVKDIFAITVQAADGQAPVWHPDVRFFKIYDASNQEIASFYLDPFSRPADKRGGAWMDECVRRSLVNGKIELPVAHLNCNSAPPVKGQPATLNFREVQTLFHEFGHGLQHMLTTVDHLDASGINGVEWDAVELPSQFMENWCYHRPTLQAMTKHIVTGESLPEELFQKLQTARKFQAGLALLRQLQFGITDMELHHSFDPNGKKTVFELAKQIAERTSVIAMLPENRTLCAFSHIFAGGYAAGYYSYKWAEVLSADAFGAFEEVGLDNSSAVQRVGKKFRDTVLALGGGRHPMQVFIDFRGREPSTTALLKQNGLAS